MASSRKSPSPSLLKQPTKRSPRPRDASELIIEWDDLFNKTWDGVKGNPDKLNDYTDRFMEHYELENAVYTVLDDFKISERLLEMICKWLFAYRRTNFEKLHLAVLNYVPSLQALCLEASVKPLDLRKKYKCVETCLLNIYNKEIVDEDGKPKKVTMRIPDMTKPSIYHTPQASTSSSPTLTESALKFLEASLPDKPIPTFGPYEQVEKLNASNRLKVMTVLLRVYYQNLNYISKNSWKVLCRVIMKLLKLSGPRNKREQIIAVEKAKAAVSAAEKTPAGVMTFDEILGVGLARVQMTSEWFVEALRCVNVFIYNGVTDLGSKALQQVHQRARHQLWTDVLLMSNAMINSFKIDPNPAPEPDLHGSRSDMRSPISTILSCTGPNRPPTTAATFKPAKLPEDIPIVPPPSEASTSEGPDVDRPGHSSAPASRTTSSKD